MRAGAMPWHHKYIGNPIMPFIGRLFFKSPANDFHCGLWGFKREAVEKIDLQTTGMELASEGRVSDQDHRPAFISQECMLAGQFRHLASAISSAIGRKPTYPRYFFFHSYSLLSASIGDSELTSTSFSSSRSGLVSGKRAACCAA